MATAFKYDLAINLVPKEIVTLDDGSDTSTVIDSNIDKILSQSYLMATGSTIFTLDPSDSGQFWHWYDAATTISNTSFSSLTSLLGITEPDNALNGVFIKITGGSGTQRLEIQLGSVTYFLLQGNNGDVPNFIFLPFSSLTATSLDVKTTSGNEPIIEVFLHGYRLA